MCDKAKRICAAAVASVILLSALGGCGKKENISSQEPQSSAEVSSEEENSTVNSETENTEESSGLNESETESSAEISAPEKPASKPSRPESSKPSASKPEAKPSKPESKPDNGAYKLPEGVTAKVKFTGKSATPVISEEHKAQQKEAGKWLTEEIIKAAKNLSVKSYTIPAGNYGFDVDTMVNGVGSGMILSDINRPDNNPFTINADGVTLWFETNGFACPSCNRNLHIMNSSNIIIKNLTIDTYTPDAIDTVVTQVDIKGNRIAVKPMEGTLELDEFTIDQFLHGKQRRIIPFKSNGDLMVPFYRPAGGWGPGALKISDVKSKDADEFWLTFEKDTLFKAMTASDWEATYGKNGVFEAGDQIMMVYGTSLLSVDNCRQITFEGLNYHSSKGTIFENGGYGNHLWKNCYLGSRKGKMRLTGGQVFQMQGLRHGSTYDGIVMDKTTDDAINIHGFWSKIKSAQGNEAVFDSAPVGILKGDRALFIDKRNGKIISELKIAETPENFYNYNGFISVNIKFDGKVPTGDNIVTRWPASECDGWTVKNCRFSNVYQRMLIQAGSGTFENNTVLNMGFNFALASNTLDYEGGVMKNITVRGNVFYNCSNSPNMPFFQISQTPNLGTGFRSGNFTVYDNVFVKCGNLLDSKNAESFIFKNNAVISPVTYRKNVNDLNGLFNKGDLTEFRLEGNSFSKKPSAMAEIEKVCRDMSKTAGSIIKAIRSLL